MLRKSTKQIFERLTKGVFIYICDVALLSMGLKKMECLKRSLPCVFLRTRPAKIMEKIVENISKFGITALLVIGGFEVY